jgi:hypothetical protein
MNVISPAMAAALKHLIETIDLAAEQIEGEDWKGAVCTARASVPVDTMVALEAYGAEGAKALAMATVLRALITTIDLNAEQIEGEDWTNAVCTARDALPEGTVAALKAMNSRP